MQILKYRNMEQGSASVFALMVGLFLLLLVTASMVLTMADARLTQDYSRNKKTFQASDSGVAHGRQTLAKATSHFSIAPSTRKDDVTEFANDAESLSTANDRDISLLVEAGSPEMGGEFHDILDRGDFKTSHTTQTTAEGLSVGYDVAFNVYPNPDNPVTRPEEGDFSHSHTFHYQYDVVSRGSAEIGGEYNQATRVERGEFDVDISRPSFATYGYFTQGMKNQFGDQLVFYDGEIYSGPTHVNSAPPEGRAGFWGQAVFNGPFSAVQESYDQSWLGGNANPQFNDSVSWGVDQIDLPENGWSQLRASVGDELNADDTSAISNEELRGHLGLPTSSNPVDAGVYYASAYNEGSELLGGIFVNGDVDYIEFKEDAGFQEIRIQTTAADGEFSGTHTWEFRSNLATGRTRVKMDNGTEAVYNSNLNGLIHVEGNVNSVRGNSSGKEIEQNHELTLSALGDVYVSDHIEYAVHPDDDPDAKNILGIFSSNGNIMLAEDAPSNLNLHATVMAASDNHGIGAEGIISGGSYNYNYANKGQWHLLGGLIENKNQTTGVFYSNGHVTGYTWDFDYDERFAEGTAPPYFPYVTKFIIQMHELEKTGWNRKYY